jgi:hypothetical protein
MIELYRQGDGYAAVTDGPKEFGDSLVITYTGSDPNNLTETAVARDDIKGAKWSNKVESVPDEWADGFRSFGLKIARPKPAKPAKPARIQPQVQEVALQVELTPDEKSILLLTIWGFITGFIFVGMTFIEFLKDLQ